MRARSYLPSKQFSVILVSLLLSVGFVYAADLATKPAHTATVAVDTQTAPVAPTDASDWQSSLNTVQAQSGVTLPLAPDQTTVNGLLQAAKSSNVTDTISRSLLVNLANAQAQGLGSDIPTQDQLINTALSQIPPVTPQKQYTSADLTIVANSSAALHAYGNNLATLIGTDSGASNDYGKTMLAVDNATSQNDATQLQSLSSVQANYIQLAQDMAAMTVPQTMEPFHLQLVNDFVKIAALYPQIDTLISDPVQGLSAIQQYNSLTAEAAQLFINIAQSLDKNAILFNKDEPGALWASVLQAQTGTQ